MRVSKLDDRTLRVGDTTIRSNDAITQVLELDAKILVLFDNYDHPEDDPNFGRNIVAYDARGNELWRIEDARVMVPGRTLDKVPQFYTGLRESQDGKVHAWVLDWRYDLNTETGAISNPKYFR